MFTRRRMSKDIPIIGFPLLKLAQLGMQQLHSIALSFPLLLSLFFLLVIGGHGSLLIAVNGQEDVVSNNDQTALAGVHPVFFSEYKLRSTIENLNIDLRQLKRDFVAHMTDTYLELKSELGVNPKRGDPAAVGLNLMAAEFADILIRKHIIERRLLAGLKVAYAKFLPLRTIRRLIEKFPENYSWLKHQSQVDLRPKFPNAKENQFVKLYSLIELRGRLRAADDVQTMTADSMKRILNAARWFVLEDRQELGVTNDELRVLSRFANKMINYYLNEIVEKANELQREFKKRMDQAGKLISIIGGEEEFLKFIDMVINREALDIDLSVAANSLDLPMTINEDMIDNLETKWIPERVLESVNNDRRVLLRYQEFVRPLISLDQESQDTDVVSQCVAASRLFCDKIPY